MIVLFVLYLYGKAKRIADHIKTDGDHPIAVILGTIFHTFIMAYGIFFWSWV